MNLPRWLMKTWLLVGPLTALASVTEARAQTPGSASETLFRQGLELNREGRFTEACEKFAASWQRQRNASSALHLGHCSRRLGQSASAWKMYREASARARAARQPDIEKSARDAAAALEPELGRVTVQVSPDDQSVPVQIFRNGALVPPEQLGQAMPVDPGEHTIEATAQGKRPWSVRVTVNASSSEIIAVPRLEVDPNASAPLPATETRASPATDAAPGHDRGASSWNVGKTLAVAAGAIGLAGATLSVVEAIAFQNERQEYQDLLDVQARCSNPEKQCAPDSPELEAATAAFGKSRDVRADASRAQSRAIAGALVGGAGFLAGAMLWFTVGQQSSRPSSAAPRVQPLVGSRLTGVSLSGSW
ncbi:MAG TPA: hypothetical protein VK524_01620 [Polyangiaceae bacterium]|nr:hypothetical protein [Polyangiaceae bacterium]